MDNLTKSHLSVQAYTEYLPNYLMLPKYISSYGKYSAFFILGEASFLFYFSKYVLGFFKLCLYITTTLHWHEVYNDSLIKRIDITMVLISNLLAGYESFLCNFFNVWLMCSTIVIIIFMINKTLFYYQVQIHKQKSIEYFNKYKPFYFSLQYTNPGTLNREYAYYRTTFTHLIFIHVIPSLISMYFLFTYNYK